MLCSLSNSSSPFREVFEVIIVEKMIDWHDHHIIEFLLANKSTEDGKAIMALSGGTLEATTWSKKFAKSQVFWTNVHHLPLFSLKVVSEVILYLA